MKDCETNDCRKEKRGCKGCYYDKEVDEICVEVEKIIAEIHTITTGIYYKQLQELLDSIVKIPYKDRKKYQIICKEVIYRECKKIGDYFNIQVVKTGYLSEKDLIVLVNHYELATNKKLSEQDKEEIKNLHKFKRMYKDGELEGE